jgi:hypothetical protein
MMKVNRVPKRRSKSRREKPRPRLDERLSALGKELDRALAAPAPAESAPDAAAAARMETETRGEPAQEPPRRTLDVPEAEVVIVRRPRTAPVLRDEPAAAGVPRADALEPADALHAPPPAVGAGGPPRAVFDGTVEEASVVIIRRPPRERTP